MNNSVKKIIFSFLIISIIYASLFSEKNSLATETTKTDTAESASTDLTPTKQEETAEDQKKEQSKDTDKETSKETTVETNKETSKETSKETTKETPQETSKELSTEKNKETKKEENKETSTSAQTQETEKEKTPQKFEFYSSEITPTIISSIIAGEGDVTIKVDGTKNISKSLFDALKGSNRTLIIKNGENEIIFKGKDIKEAKNIDASISISQAKDNSDIKELTENGIVITFANNGELPGNATIKIKVNNDIKTHLDLSKTVLLYFYNENTKQLEKENVSIKYEKEYIEFVIDHNSKFILTDGEIIAKENESSEKIEENSQTAKEATSVEYNKNTIMSDLIHLLVVITIVFFVVVIVVVIIVIKVKKSKNKNKYNTEEYDDEDEEADEYEDEEDDDEEDDDDEYEDEEDEEDEYEDDEDNS